MTGAIVRVVAALTLIALAPLLGAALAGEPLGPYLALPPRPPEPPPTELSWPAFIALAAVIAAVLAPFVIRAVRAAARLPRSRPAGRFPGWGWLALALLTVSWIVAWTRLEPITPFQPHTFAPLWLGYVITVQALVQRRAGSCLMTARPGLFLALFPASAVFWWLFEYLNQFTANWHYIGGPDRSDLGYFAASTPPFCTVLPAVIGTRDLLASHPRLGVGLASLAQFAPPARPRVLAAAAVAAGAAGLVLLPVAPRLLFPLLWLAPTVVLLGVAALAGQRTLLDPLARGDGRPVWHAALAALVCGVFWELWNAGSLVHWRYAIPGVDGMHVFEMPLPGYAGYLPFGIACVAATALTLGDRDALLFGPQGKR